MMWRLSLMNHVTPNVAKFAVATTFRSFSSTSMLRDLPQQGGFQQSGLPHGSFQGGPKVGSAAGTSMSPQQQASAPVPTSVGAGPWQLAVCARDLSLGLDDAIRNFHTLSSSDRIVIVRGPPGGGKSTFAWALGSEEHVLSRPHRYFSTVGSVWQDIKAHPAWFLSNTAIVDECQGMLDTDLKEVPQFFKDNEGTKVVFTGTMAGAPTPFGDGTGHYFLSGRMASAEPTRKWFLSNLKNTPTAAQWTDKEKELFTAIAVATTSSHVGLLQSVGKAVSKRSEQAYFTTEVSTVEFVIDSMKRHRLLKTNGVNTIEGIRGQITADVMIGGSTLREMNSSIRGGIDGGLFFPRNTDLRPQAGLQKIEEAKRTELVLAHPAQWEFSSVHEEALADNTSSVKTDTPQNSIDLLLGVVPCLQWVSFLACQKGNQKTSFDDGASSIREGEFVKIFNKTGKKVFGEEVFKYKEQDPYVHYCNSKEKIYRLDAVYTLGGKTIGIEFLNCHSAIENPFKRWKKKEYLTFAQDFAEHHGRWDNKYQEATTRYTEHRTVGVVGPSGGVVTVEHIKEIGKQCQLKRVKDHPWAVVSISGHSEATLFCGESTSDMLEPKPALMVVRNGVPQKLGLRRGVQAIVTARTTWIMSLNIDDDDRAVLVKERINEDNIAYLKEDNLKEMGFSVGTRGTLLQEIEKRRRLVAPATDCK